MLQLPFPVLRRPQKTASRVASVRSPTFVIGVPLGVPRANSSQKNDDQVIANQTNGVMNDLLPAPGLPVLAAVLAHERPIDGRVQVLTLDLSICESLNFRAILRRNVTSPHPLLDYSVARQAEDPRDGGLTSEVLDGLLDSVHGTDSIQEILALLVFPAVPLFFIVVRIRA
ncbi:hypothetical protein CBM2599_A120526 [Cupriavidus taiwanensis]|nr:hypothetical protein CBM2599_A120526 [Cupriavidus taiwanensis]SOY81930.1 hypothetical protein CBM2600_A120548 [Cupriavidus taiwanensis]